MKIDYVKAYVVCWKSRITGYEGHSLEPMSLEFAQAIVAHKNAKYPDIDHWVERANRVLKKYEIMWVIKKEIVYQLKNNRQNFIQNLSQKFHRSDIDILINLFTRHWSYNETNQNVFCWVTSKSDLDKDQNGYLNLLATFHKHTNGILAINSNDLDENFKKYLAQDAEFQILIPLVNSLIVYDRQ